MVSLDTDGIMFHILRKAKAKILTSIIIVGRRIAGTKGLLIYLLTKIIGCGWKESFCVTVPLG
jgi:hypothetical protein